MNSKGKRKAPNGMYWGNVINKCVMIEPLGNGVFRAWSNSEKFISSNAWTLPIARLGWGYRDFLEEEVNFYDWN